MQVDNYNEMRDRFERTHRGAEKFPGTTITYLSRRDTFVGVYEDKKKHVCEEKGPVILATEDFFFLGFDADFQRHLRNRQNQNDDVYLEDPQLISSGSKSIPRV